MTSAPTSMIQNDIMRESPKTIDTSLVIGSKDRACTLANWLIATGIRFSYVDLKEDMSKITMENMRDYDTALNIYRSMSEMWMSSKK